MTTIPQLRTGSCINKFLDNTKGPTYAREHTNNRARMPRIVRTSNTSTYPQADRNKRILRGDILHPTSVKKEHREDASASQPIEQRLGAKSLVLASRSRGASNNRFHCSRDSDEDGQMPERPERTETRPPETRSRLEPWIRKRPQEPRQVREGRPERPGNQTKNTKVNLHPSKNPKNPSVSKLQQPNVLICQSKMPMASTLGPHCWARMRRLAGTKGAKEKRVHKHTHLGCTLRPISYVLQSQMSA